MRTTIAFPNTKVTGQRTNGLFSIVFLRVRIYGEKAFKKDLGFSFNETTQKTQA